MRGNCLGMDVDWREEGKGARGRGFFGFRVGSGWIGFYLDAWYAIWSARERKRGRGAFVMKEERRRRGIPSRRVSSLPLVYLLNMEPEMCRIKYESNADIYSMYTILLMFKIKEKKRLQESVARSLREESDA